MKLIQVTRDWLRDHPASIAYALVVVATIGGYISVRDVARSNREDTCVAVLESQVTLRNIVAPLANSPQAAARRYYEYVDAQLNVPPVVCDDTGINIPKKLRELDEGRPLIPFLSSSTTVVEGPAGPAGPPGPAGRTGPAGRAGSAGRAGRDASTTTTAPSSSTTTEPRRCFGAICVQE